MFKRIARYFSAPIQRERDKQRLRDEIRSRPVKDGGDAMPPTLAQLKSIADLAEVTNLTDRGDAVSARTAKGVHAVKGEMREPLSWSEASEIIDGLTARVTLTPAAVSIDAGSVVSRCPERHPKQSGVWRKIGNSLLFGAASAALGFVALFTVFMFINGALGIFEYALLGLITLFLFVAVTASQFRFQNTPCYFCGYTPNLYDD